ncbi:hypothetical protein FQN54_008607 [Arachnomyces sp. PD_36]|nr:hypothetical protein FQN54_008607 [Arachnomyces sp. PD_36]
MFGNSIRSASTSVRGYVCSSCLVRRNIRSPAQQQTLRFLSTSSAHPEPVPALSDPILPTIGECGKKQNGDGAVADSTDAPFTKNDEEPNADSPKKSKSSGKAKGRKSNKKKSVKGASSKSSTKESSKSPAARPLIRKLYTPGPEEGGGIGEDAARKPDHSNFIQNLKSLRAQKQETPESGEGKAGIKRQGAKISLEVDTLRADDMELTPVDTEMPSVPKLSYGLDRVLFNPGVYHLQDPRSRVYNFDPYLGSIMPISEFDFDALNEYITSSKDQSLHDLASKLGKKYVGSSSSMTSVLSHFHFLLSQWREINTSTVSQGFPSPLRSFTKLSRGPAAVFLRYKDGVYAVDADKEFENATVLMNLGKSMEKLLTLSTEDFERYRRTSKNKISQDEQTDPEAYHFSTIGDFVIRSQLDAYDPRLPGTGMFDLKTRAVVSIRMNTKNPEPGLGYQIKGRFGGYESYEREYFDMIRAAFLKYSLQVRIGRMDGIFVAFHNTERIFGFQYISLPEMDHSLHGQEDTTLGDTEFKHSMSLWNKILDRATQRFPEQSLRFHFETREAQSPFMYIFAEPVTDDEMQVIQTRRAEDVELAQKKLLYPELFKDEAEEKSAESSSGTEFGVGEGYQSLEEAMSGETSPAETLSAAEGTTPAESGTVGQDGSSAQTPAQDSDNTKDTTEPENEQYDSESATDSEFLDGLRLPKDTNQKPLLGMTLAIKNKVNGEQVSRPIELGAGDKWTVDYELNEFTSLSRAWTVYEACQKRRAKLSDYEEDDDKKSSVYLQKLHEISAEGRAWREKQDEIDRDFGTIALNLESKDPAAVNEVVRNDSPSSSSTPPSSADPSSPPARSSSSSAGASSSSADSSSSAFSRFSKFFS